MEQLRNEIRDLEIQRNSTLFENEQLHSDLIQATQDAVHFMGLLKKSRVEQEELQIQLKDYFCEIERVENELSSREYEHSDLIQHLNFLNQEASMLKTKKQTSSDELQSYKEKITEAEKEIMKLEAYILEKECVVKSLERKLVEISSFRNQLEEQLQCIEKEKHGETQELAHCQQTLQDLLMQKEALCHQLTASERCIEKIERELEERKTFMCLLQEELTRERQHSIKCENFLRETKMEFREVRLCNQRYQEEILGLSDKVAYLYAKLQDERLENNSFQTNIETLREQITTARHEQSYSMKRELEQKHVTLLSKSKDISHANFNTKINRKETKNCKKIMKERRHLIESRKTFVNNVSCGASVHLQKQGERLSKTCNEKIKESDLRYMLYLENVTKIQSYEEKKNKRKKKDTDQQCRQYMPRKNKEKNHNIKTFDMDESIFKKNEEQKTNFQVQCQLISNNNIVNLRTNCPLTKDKIHTNELELKDLKNNILERLCSEINRSEDPSKIQKISKEGKYSRGKGKSVKGNTDVLLSEEMKTITMEHFSKKVNKPEITYNKMPNKVKDGHSNEHAQQDSNFQKQPARTNLLQSEFNSTKINENIDSSDFRQDVTKEKFIISPSKRVETVQQVFTNTNNNCTKITMQQALCFKNKGINSAYHHLEKSKKIEKITDDGHRKLQDKLNWLKTQETDPLRRSHQNGTACRQ